ncbi:hypothetical protein JKF63_07092 [Porcisia hertigi]|uniref:FHA domain-containing protein n=1 Tax=Porcisia hertigi TaxID=2761500 RepID=A0A836LKB5_9TRYP|nr:hypothetical protein JKF63_07092 [Porcisia hertigi]
MADDIEVTFVLVRGPRSIDRRMHVTLSSNATPVTVGRATHCAALLDPSLLFSSQLQCSLFAMRVKNAVAAASPSITTTVTDTSPMATDVRSTPNRTDAGDSTPHCGATPIDAADALRTPLHQHTLRDGQLPASITRVYMTDMCSSNGTFVNGIRISGTDPTELKQGDVCIFGGMRDVNVGEAIPADAYDGPELVQWRVDLRSSAEQPHETFEYTPTPLVLSARDVLELEERELLETAQRSLVKAARRDVCTPSPSTSAATAVMTAKKQHSLNLAVADSPDCLSAAFVPPMGGGSLHSVPQQLFASPVVHERDVTRQPSTAEVEETPQHGGPGRRSVSLVASEEAHVTSIEAAEEKDSVEDPIDHTHTPLTDVVAMAVPADPPTAVLYDMVRLGNISYDARAEVGEEGHLAAVEEAGDEEDAEPLPPPGKRRRCSSPPSTTPQRQGWERSEDMATAAVVASNQLTFTPTHFKWTMPNPNEIWSRLHHSLSGEATAPAAAAAAADGAAASHNSVTSGRATKTFYGMLPVTSLETLVACPERLGIAVELKDGCQLPLVDAAVLNGSAGSRWVVWVLSPQMRAVQAPAHEAQSGGRGRSKMTKGGADKTGKKREKTPSTAAVLEESPLTPAERFEEWLMHLKLYYAAQKVPAPVVVDGATFDVISSPLFPSKPPSSPSSEPPPQ